MSESVRDEEVELLMQLVVDVQRGWLDIECLECELFMLFSQQFVQQGQNVCWVQAEQQL